MKLELWDIRRRRIVRTWRLSDGDGYVEAFSSANGLIAALGRGTDVNLLSLK